MEKSTSLLGSSEKLDHKANHCPKNWTVEHRGSKFIGT